MKSIDNYIREKLVLTKDIINKNTNKEYIFNDIDVTKFEWHATYSENSYQRKCKEIVKKFANDIFSNSNIRGVDRLSELFKMSYKYYLNNLPEDKINDRYNSSIMLLDKYGWGQFEYACLEQGWWVFMKWVIEKYNKKNNG